MIYDDNIHCIKTATKAHGCSAVQYDAVYGNIPIAKQLAFVTKHSLANNRINFANEFITAVCTQGTNLMRMRVQAVISVAVMLLLICNSALAIASTSNNTVGWHWYNQPVHKKPSQKHQTNQALKAFNQLSPAAQLKLLQEATKNLRDKAVLSGRVSDITAYKQAQDFWVNKARRFTVGWEKMLLQHPGLNYALRHPHANALAPVMAAQQHKKEDEAIAQLSQSMGLLLFYRGSQQGDVMFASVVKHYAQSHHLAVMSIAVDSKQQLLMKAMQLGVRYFPALVLVNPKTGQHPNC